MHFMTQQFESDELATQNQVNVNKSLIVTLNISSMSNSEFCLGLLDCNWCLCCIERSKIES